MPKRSQEAIYLYCFARAGLLSSFGRRRKGIDVDKPPSVHVNADIAAVVDRVPLEEFTGPEAEARLKDIEWVGPRAYWHQKIIEAAAKRSPVFPVGMGTLFVSLDSLDRLIEKEREKIAQFLDAVSGKEEWAIKAFVQPVKAHQKTLGRRLETNKPPNTPGARYLFEKRMQTQAGEAMNQWLDEMLHEARDELRPLAEDFRERKVIMASESAGAEREEMAANWAFLISTEKKAAFMEAIVRFNIEHAEEEGLFFRSSGPWPPYSFTPPLQTEPDA